MRDLERHRVDAEFNVDMKVSGWVQEWVRHTKLDVSMIEDVSDV
jgi:hypothetical protein